jgi:hypothetical protein
MATSRTFVVMVIGFLGGCAPPNVPPAASLAPPKVALMKPAGHAKIRSRQPIDFVGQVAVNNNEWVPSIVTVKIYEDKKGRFSQGSFAVRPEPSGEVGLFRFRATLKAPAKTGKYIVRVVCTGPSSTGGGGNSIPSAPTESYEDIEIEVVP